MAMRITWKDDRVFFNAHKVAWHKNLIKVALWIYMVTGEIIGTSAYRDKKIHDGDSGIHMTNPLRAIDIRHFIYSNPWWLCNYINENWIYDPQRPDIKVAVLHDTGLGMHFHIQVHEKTIKREEVEK